MTASAFDYGSEPYWRDLTPHPDCQVTVEQYPAPRPCAWGRDVCHLGHPANCRWHTDACIAEAEADR